MLMSDFWNQNLLTFVVTESVSEDRRKKSWNDIKITYMSEWFAKRHQFLYFTGLIPSYTSRLPLSPAQCCSSNAMLVVTNSLTRVRSEVSVKPVLPVTRGAASIVTKNTRSSKYWSPGCCETPACSKMLLTIINTVIDSPVCFGKAGVVLPEEALLHCERTCTRQPRVARAGYAQAGTPKTRTVIPLLQQALLLLLVLRAGLGVPKAGACFFQKLFTSRGSTFCVSRKGSPKEPFVSGMQKLPSQVPARPGVDIRRLLAAASNRDRCVRRGRHSNGTDLLAVMVTW